MSQIEAPATPNLPLPKTDYSQLYFNQLTNVLRLYFNQLGNGLSSLFSNSGGSFLRFSFIALSDSADQLATASNTPTEVVFTDIEGSNGFNLIAPGTAETLVSGIYKITYSLQYVNTDNVAHDVEVWLQVNSVNVPRSNTKFSIPARKSVGVFSFICAYSEVVFTLNAGDELELYWATNQAFSVSPAVAGVYMEHLNAITSPYVRPATPSAIVSITFVSALP